MVLSLSGHDPGGGAGIQADAEAVTAMGCRSCSVITALTEQDSRNVYQVWPQSAAVFLSQAQRCIEDFSPDAIKIGLVASCDIVEAIVEILAMPILAGVPVILDPVLAAGGGTPLSHDLLLQTMRERLLPRCRIITPNTQEALRLGGRDDLPGAAYSLQAMGVSHVLITGTHAHSVDVINTLYADTGEIQTWRWPRLPHSYHGSGCTLASALAGLLARGYPLTSAVGLAQRYTWSSLRAAEHPGQGQYLPRR